MSSCNDAVNLTASNVQLEKKPEDNLTESNVHPEQNPEDNLTERNVHPEQNTEDNLTVSNAQPEQNPEASPNHQQQQQLQQSEELNHSSINDVAELEVELESPPELASAQENLTRPGAFAMHFGGAPIDIDDLHDDLTQAEDVVEESTGALQEQQSDETPLFVLSAMPVDEAAEADRDHRLAELERGRLHERQRMQELETRLNQLGQQPIVTATPLEVRLEVTGEADSPDEARLEATEEVGASHWNEHKRFKKALLSFYCLGSHRKLTCITLALIVVAVVVAVSLGMALSGDKSTEPILTEPPATEAPTMIPPTTVPPTRPTFWWSQLGNDIVGKAEYDFFGSSMALSNDGYIMASGATGSDNNRGLVRVFQFNSTTSEWNQMGQDIAGTAQWDFFGESEDLSADGGTVAVGADSNDANETSGDFGNFGEVRVFRYDRTGNYWNQTGQEINGGEADDHFGRVVALSADGNILAVGADESGKEGPISGYVRVFSYDSATNEWMQIGQRVNGEGSLERTFRVSVALSANGTILAFGYSGNGENGRKSGQVRVFQYDATTDRWNQTGPSIYGETRQDQFGGSVDLSADGSILASGAMYNDQNGANSGHVRVFQYTATDHWVQMGGDINGEEEEDTFGVAVALSADGNVVTAGGHQVERDGLTRPGYARVFRYNNNTKEWEQIGQRINGTAPDDEFGRAVAISSDGTVVGAGAAQNDKNGSENVGHVRVFFVSDSTLE